MKKTWNKSEARRIEILDWTETQWTLPINPSSSSHSAPPSRFRDGREFGLLLDRGTAMGNSCRKPSKNGLGFTSLTLNGLVEGMPLAAVQAGLIWRRWRRPLVSLRRRCGFTLVELLVVIAIIAILAGILLPAIGGMRKSAKIKTAKVEMANLAAAISQYEAEYSRFPSSKKAEDIAAMNNQNDFTFSFNNSLPNSEVMAILLDRGADEQGGPNQDHRRNPRRKVFFSPKESAGNTLPGLGEDLVFRDPWGNPYVITLDLNADNICEDEQYYATTNVLHAAVAIWSFGPDQVNQGVTDRDNILSWK